MYGIYLGLKKPCEKCHGTGCYIGNNIAEACSACHGAGYIFVKEDRMAVEGAHHPQHYNVGKFEVIDVIEDWQLSFNIGNCVKYLARYKHKKDPKQDLLKAWWYLTRELLVEWKVQSAELISMTSTVVKQRQSEDEKRLFVPGTLG